VYAESIGKLIEEFKSFPGIGRKTAERMAFHILVSKKDAALKLANTIIETKEKVHPCTRCFHITDVDPCAICSNDQRERKLLCVVEQPKDVLAIERMGLYRGLYHVLLGAISLLDGVRERDLTIDVLLKRVKEEGIEEVILATAPSLEGDTTALTISQRLEAMNIKVSRIARGLPTGSSIETVSKAILADALETRRPFKNQGA
jgi:recombination protein RecR